LDFRLAILGENFQAVPKVFIAARERFGDRILHYGYVDSKEEYHRWLRRGDIVISTANQENFGISTVEAIRFGCLPLLPRRLSYPEILSERFHPLCLYHRQEDLVVKLGHALENIDTFSTLRRDLAMVMARYAWENLISSYDGELSALAVRQKIESI